MHCPKGHWFAEKRHTWTSNENIRQLHEILSEQWIEAGVAVPLLEEEHYWISDVGKQVETGEESAGLKVNVEMIHLQYVLPCALLDEHDTWM